jgi:hypothetical protein
MATLARGKAHEQAVAIAVLGERHQAEALSEVARQVLNPFPLVRYYARKALGEISGRPCDIDPERPIAEIQAALGRCLPALRVGARGQAGHRDGDELDED